MSSRKDGHRMTEYFNQESCKRAHIMETSEINKPLLVHLKESVGENLWHNNLVQHRKIEIYLYNTMFFFCKF